MATWGAHIRIAEAILNNNKSYDIEKFLVGNIGPDCGEPNEDWSQFSPPKEISHFIRDDRTINSEEFYAKYLNRSIANKELYSFLVGYYVHLLTDIEWGRMVDEKKSTDSNYQRLENDRKFIWTIKEDWYDLDHLYFKRNPQSIFHKVFKHIKDFPDYLDYYPKVGIDRQLKYIIDYYSNYAGNPEREYIYLTEEEMDSFVDEKSKLIMDALKLKGY